MSNSTSSDRTKDAEERVKKGYEKATGKKPSPHDLELLTTKQIKHFYRAGSNKQRSKKRILIYSALMLCTVASGVLAYQYFTHSNDESDGTKSMGILDPSTSFSVNKTPSADNQASPTPSQASPSTSTSPAKGSPSNQTSNPSSNSQYQSPNCVMTNTPYKTYVKRGSRQIGSRYGYDGRTQTCTYSDGRVTTIKLSDPQDQYLYVNVNSADYATAYGVCSNITENPSQAIVNDCMALVWTPNE